MTDEAPLRILLADDGVLFRESLARVLATQPDFDVIGQAGTGAEAVEAAMRLRPDVVVMDVEMPEMDGVTAAAILLKILLKSLPSAKIVMLTISDADRYLLDAIRLGVQGYLLKDLTPEELFEMLRRVRHAENPVSPALVGRLFQALRTPTGAPTASDGPSEPLSVRETEILGLIADGLTNREIGQQLFITEGTVKNHVHNILRKLALENRGQAAAYVMHQGLSLR